MSHKSPKIAALISDCADDPRYDAHYKGYFKCFNQQLYYEAHDVLEELWLADKKGTKGNFYKGLIQLAGAFVHLQKNRLKPAFRLFALAVANLSKYPDIFEGHDVGDTRHRLANEYMQALQKGRLHEEPVDERNRSAAHPQLAPQNVPPALDRVPIWKYFKVKR